MLIGLLLTAHRELTYHTLLLAKNSFSQCLNQEIKRAWPWEKNEFHIDFYLTAKFSSVG